MRSARVRNLLRFRMRLHTRLSPHLSCTTTASRIRLRISSHGHWQTATSSSADMPRLARTTPTCACRRRLPASCTCSTRQSGCVSTRNPRIGTRAPCCSLLKGRRRACVRISLLQGTCCRRHTRHSTPARIRCRRRCRSPQTCCAAVMSRRWWWPWAPSPAVSKQWLQRVKPWSSHTLCSLLLAKHPPSALTRVP